MKHVNLCPFPVGYPVPSMVVEPHPDASRLPGMRHDDIRRVFGLQIGDFVLVPDEPDIVQAAQDAFLYVIAVTRGNLIQRHVGFGLCKIVDTGNFGGDYPDERVIADNIPSPVMAQVMADALNDRSGPDARRYYKVVPAGYVLQPGFEP